MKHQIELTPHLKQEFSDDDLDIFCNLITNDMRNAFESDKKTNRNFSSYDIEELEACSKNSEKKIYNSSHLKKDLAFYFSYLPTTEVDRVVNTVFWLLAESIKNYGHVTIPGFGKFFTYDRPYKVRYNLTTGDKYTIPLMKLRRVLDFTPSSVLKNVITPRKLLYMRASPENTFDIKEFPDLMTAFSIEKGHRRKGQVLIQKAFDDKFRYKGYTDSYISAIYNGDM